MIVTTGSPPSCPRRRAAIEAAAEIAGGIDHAVDRKGLVVVAQVFDGVIAVRIRRLSRRELRRLGLRPSPSTVTLVALVDSEVYAVPLRVMPLCRGGSC